MLTKNKKGNFVAWFFVIIVLMAFSIFALVLYNSWDHIKDPMAEEFEKAIPDNSNVNVTDILGGVGDTTKNFSNMMPFLIIGLFAFVLITAGAIIKHPIMIFVGIIVLGVVILIAITFSNVYSEMADSEGFTDSDSELGVQGKFMDYLPVIIFVMAIGIFAAVLYGKSQAGGGSL